MHALIRRDLLCRGQLAAGGGVERQAPLGGLFRITHIPCWKMERFPAHIRDMAIPCSKCTVRAAVGMENEFVFFGGQCIELLGTLYVNRFEWCPILSEAIAREVRRSPSIATALALPRQPPFRRSASEGQQE
jgi:hypothetical protein